MIRPAIPADIHRLLEMGNAFFIETGWDKHADFDAESFAFACGSLMDNGILLVAEKGDAVVGMTGAGLAAAYWNRNVLTAQELFWYMEPDFRKDPKKLGRALLEALEEAVKALGVKLFSMSAEEGLRSKALGHLYRQRGYFPMEQLFWKGFSA